MALDREVLRGSWLATNMENGGFGNNFEVKPFVNYTMAASLDELADNMMLAKQMFFSGFSEKEISSARSVLREELQKLRTFEIFDLSANFAGVLVAYCLIKIYKSWNRI